jgi:hypothetical protein
MKSRLALFVAIVLVLGLLLMHASHNDAFGHGPIGVPPPCPPTCK